MTSITSLINLETDKEGRLFKSKRIAANLSPNWLALGLSGLALGLSELLCLAKLLRLKLNI